MSIGYLYYNSKSVYSVLPYVCPTAKGSETERFSDLKFFTKHYYAVYFNATIFNSQFYLNADMYGHFKFSRLLRGFINRLPATVGYGHFSTSRIDLNRPVKIFVVTHANQALSS